MERNKTHRELEAEIESLRLRLQEAEETLSAIRNNEIDALVVDGQVYTLQGAEQTYRILMETMSEGALTVASDGTILYCNSHFSELVRMPLNNVLGGSFNDFLVSQDSASLEKLLATCGRDACRGEFLLRGADGRNVPVSLSARSLMLADVEAFFIVAADLTDQKRTQQALEEGQTLLEERIAERTSELFQVNTLLQEEIVDREAAQDALRMSEERFRLAFSNMTFAALLVNEYDRIDFANPAFCDLFNLEETPGDLEELTSAEILAKIRPAYLNPDEDLARVIEIVNRGEFVQDEEVPMQGGRTFLRDFVPVPRGDNKRGRLWVHKDITERKRQSKLLTGINRIFHEAITCETEDELGSACLSVAEELTESRIGFIGEVHPDGLLYDITISNPGWDQCQTYPKGHSGSIGAFTIHGLYGHVLSHGRSLLTNDPAAHPDSIGLPEGHPPLTSFLGVPLREKGETIGLIAVGNREGGYGPQQQEILEALAPAIVQVVLRRRAEDAVLKSRDELEVRVREAVEELRRTYDKLLEETRDRQQAEQQLRQAQKLEALGTLAGGIAHDFNNLLGAVIGFTELLLEDLPEGNPAHGYAARVLEAGLRGRDLVKHMLAFSRQTELERKPLRLSSIIKESVKLLRSSIPTTISINVNVTSESNLILADPIQVQQVFMNLCTNAYHAMREKGGILNIELTDFSVGTSDEHAEGIEPGFYMKLSVRDTGVGIPVQIKERYFDPFFTTKAVGEGTGLGLSVVMGIVKQSGGYITVESEPGKGSTFSIYFPKIMERAAADALYEDEALPAGTERILVDDEEALLEMGERILSKLGYEVISRIKSKEALALFRMNPLAFDLAVVDQTMPDLTGTDLAGEMINIRPDMPVILCTGFSHLVDEDSAKAAGIKGFVMKPVTRREIAKVIRKVLDEGK